MFGQNYQEKEPAQNVPEGDYTVRLGLPEDMERGGYRIREIPIQIKDYPGANPTHWSIFDMPTDSQENIDKWNRNMTKNCDAFKVRRGDFNPASWQGKVGKVHIGKDKAGYMKVMYSILDSAPGVPPIQQQAPATAPATASAPPTVKNQWPQPEPSSYTPPVAPADGFVDDDIVF